MVCVMMVFGNEITTNHFIFLTIFCKNYIFMQNKYSHANQVVSEMWK